MIHLLVTGHEGYIGSNFINYVETNALPITIYRYEGDIMDFDLPCDGFLEPFYGQRETCMVLHLAALAGVRKSLEQPDLYWRNNVLGTRRVFAKCQQHNVKLLFASSSNAHDVTNPYAETKKQNELDRISDCVGFRPHTVYPGRPDMLFQRLRNKEVTYINTGHTRDFTHIFDICSALWTIMKNYPALRGEVVDIGTGEAIPVTDVALGMGFTGEMVNDPTPNERTHTAADISRLKSFGWEPKYKILDVIDW